MKNLNQCKGTLISKTMSNSTIEVLTETMVDQKMIKVEHMKIWKKIDGCLIIFEKQQLLSSCEENKLA